MEDPNIKDYKIDVYDKLIGQVLCPETIARINNLTPNGKVSNINDNGNITINFKEDNSHKNLYDFYNYWIENSPGMKEYLLRNQEILKSLENEYNKYYKDKFDYRNIRKYLGFDNNMDNEKLIDYIKSRYDNEL